MYFKILGMKKIIPVLLLLIFVFIFLSCITSTSGKQDKITSTNNRTNDSNLSVLELFTSQGCSSCPPADRLLGKYAKMRNVIALSYHVDYWNRLGWKDPFSSNIFSQRQNDYADHFKLNGVYTPQLIINGQKEMVGSDANKIEETLTKQQNIESAVIKINEIKSDGDKLMLNYTIHGIQNGSVLNIALIQNEITTSIKAGENSGVDLTNYNVVRSFKQINVTSDETNKVDIDMVKQADRTNLSIVAFLQNKQTFKIYAATKSLL